MTTSPSTDTTTPAGIPATSRAALTSRPRIPTGPGVVPAFAPRPASAARLHAPVPRCARGPRQWDRRIGCLPARDLFVALVPQPACPGNPRVALCLFGSRMSGFRMGHGLRALLFVRGGRFPLVMEAGQLLGPGRAPLLFSVGRLDRPAPALCQASASCSRWVATDVARAYAVSAAWTSPGTRPGAGYPAPPTVSGRSAYPRPGFGLAPRLEAPPRDLRARAPAARSATRGVRHAPVPLWSTAARRFPRPAHNRSVPQSWSRRAAERGIICCSGRAHAPVPPRHARGALQGHAAR